MPWPAIALLLAGPTILGLARITLWTIHALGYPRDKRPGYVDLRRQR